MSARREASFQAHIAVTDLETTGPDPFRHEIIEIGLVLLDAAGNTLETWSAKVTPQNLSAADPVALAINGYTDDAWRDAQTLEQALRVYAEKTRDALFCSHCATVDWAFLSSALRSYGFNHMTEYHRIDTFSLAWHALKNNPPKSFHLKDIALHLGLTPEPEPHQALQGALLAAEVYKKLMG